jgi:replication factor C subunit 1
MEKTDDTLSSMAKDRASGRKRKAAKYAGEEDEDADFAPLPKGEEDSGSDVFQADFKTRKQMAGDYDEESGDDVKIIKPRKRASTKKTESENEDLKLPVHKSTNGKKTPSVASSRKRKSVSLEEDEYTSEDGNAKSSKRGRKKPSSSKKPAVKKPRATKSGESKPKKPTAKEVVPENTEIQAIFDSIPIIAPPSPPASTGDEKPKFKFNGHQNSGPASAAGSKEIPLGQENCLGGLGFVFTGLLSALSRDEGQDLVKRYGGKVLSSVSSKTSYVVLGSDAGPKKLETIAKFNIKTINEDGLFALITRLPANGGDGRAAAVNEAKKKKEEDNVKKMAAEMEEAEKQRVKALASKSKNTPASNQPTIDSRLWTVKYSPTSTSQICGNKGVVEKLQRWLRAWPDNLQKEFKHAGADGSSKFRAVIIHGPPGIGKTTAAHLVANLEGYDVIESNASDTRSKKLVDTGLKGILDNTSLLGYFAGDDKKVEAKKKKIVLIMDEVDGMSAGDRGGVGALAQVCKKTSVPMILICNDRRLPKMKPFDFVAFDLPFRKPTTQDIRSRINTICFREGIKLPAQVIDALIEGSKADIRQIINMISTVKLDDAALDFDQSKSMSKAWEKHIILKPWDVVQQLLSGGMFHATSTKTLNDKIELYFNDHELSFLMLEENYLKSTPTALNDYQGRRRSLKALELADSAAESISDGDLVDRMIHGPQQHWSLMPTHAVFSTVRPASFIAGTMVGSGGPKFPAWLGNNSKQSKPIFLSKSITICSYFFSKACPICQRNSGTYETSNIWRSTRNPPTILAYVVVFFDQTIRTRGQGLGGRHYRVDGQLLLDKRRLGCHS